MLREAIKDKDNYKFTYVTDTSISLRTKDEVYKIITQDHFSYFDYF